MSILFIDNRDSFSYNIIDALYRLGARDAKILDSQLPLFSLHEWQKQILDINPSHIIIGPGPGAPSDLPHLTHLIRHYEGKTPILGICLGHQIIVEAYHGKVHPTGTPMHGKRSLIQHTSESALFASIPKCFYAGRYHSLAAVQVLTPLIVTAKSADEGEETIMAVEHMRAPIFGVQFHPESFLSEHGLTLLGNFLNMSSNIML